MAASSHQVDPTEVRELLGLLEQRLIDEGVDAQVHVIGGSAMALLFPNDDETRVTRDIDAAVYPLPLVRRVVEQIAEELALPPSWLNANGSPFMPPRQQGPRQSRGVTVTVATVEELIAMKLAASRDQDLFDLGILARHAGITDPARLVQIAFDAYGDDSMILTDSREDYLHLAREALAAAEKRSRAKRPGRRRP